MIYPIRINKYLALKNISTRRGADKLISDKKVFINKKIALLGDKVNENDKVEVKDKEKTEYVYYAYNKPIGIITHSPQNEEIEIKDKIAKNNLPKNIFPIGRLDKNSEGLIILTNDGRITDKLLNPKYYHEKEYIVKTKNKLRSSFKEKMENGVNIDPVRSKHYKHLNKSSYINKTSNGVEGYKTKPCKIKIVNENTFNIILTEGKKHQIRRMCSALFQEVESLKRVRILNIKLENLKTNSYREIKDKELEKFLGLLSNLN